MGVEIREAQIRVAIGDRVGNSRLDLTSHVRPRQSDVHVASEVHALAAGPVEAEIELARPRLGKVYPRPADVGRIHWIAVESQVEIAVGDVVNAVAARFRSGKRDARSLEPQRIAREIEYSSQAAYVRHRWTERRRNHLERRDVDLAIPVRWIFQSHQRENSVDAVKREFFLVAVRHFENLQPLLGTERAANRVLLLGGALVRIGLPRRAHQQIALNHGDVAETNPRSPAGLARTRGRRRVTRENPVVIPFSARRLVEHDNRPYQFHFIEVDLLAAQRAQAVARPHLVDFDEGCVRAVGDDDVVQGESAQQIAGDSADVHQAVTVSLDQAFDITADALAAPVGVGDEQDSAEQKQHHHDDSRDDAQPPPTH